MHAMPLHQVILQRIPLGTIKVVFSSAAGVRHPTMTTKGRANSTRRMRAADISSVESGLSALREDTRVLGRPAAEQPSESLFFMDASAAGRQAVRKVAIRSRLDEILVPSSKIPALVRKNSAPGGSADDVRVARLAKAEPRKRAPDSPSADLWAEDDDSASRNKRTVRRSLAVPHAGSSYIPAPDAHAELLAAAQAVRDQAAQKEAAIAARIPAAPVLGAIFRRATDVDQLLREDTRGPADTGSAVSGAATSGADFVDPQSHKKKTRKDRNREKRARAAELEVRLAEKDGALLAQIDAVVSEGVPAVAAESASRVHVVSKAQRRRLNAAAIAVAAPEAVGGSLRTLRPEGALYVSDRVLALQPRGLVAPPPVPRKSRFAY